jgi:hypothetical protein
MSIPITRRAFLATSAEVVAVAAVIPAIARGGTPPEPRGTVYGRTGPAGIRAGSPGRPARGRAILLDGRELEVSHATAWRIGPGKGVLLSPEPTGAWSILYAEA